MANILTRFSAILLAAFCASAGRAADLYQYEVSEIKAPDCLQDVSAAFFSQNDQQTEPIHPVLPVSNFYLLVRYLGDDAIAAAPPFDFARFPETYGDPSIRGWPLTDLRVPDPKSAWQRATGPDATMDNSSAFQVHCFDAASLINAVASTGSRTSGARTMAAIALMKATGNMTRVNNARVNSFQAVFRKAPSSGAFLCGAKRGAPAHPVWCSRGPVG